ncbi:hypothetical protein [Pedobacter sp. Hv1]|uniref:hypothetical protein n=1 Tax=Pedobacter sp. Hv1 TaxID=1740090 RepID=UPI0006D8B978|nr:hypothetical protein [Pedobacter sp. Hv1]KQB99364.1 hypothetical protein AQF98_17480 [Pedobacter sp. Hv1]
MITPNKKNKTILWGMLAVVLLVISSCAKDKITNEETNKLLPLENAKLNSLKQSYGRQESLVLNNDNWINSLSPDWAKINVNIVDGSKVYEVSLKNPKRVFATTTVVDKRNAEQLVNSSLTKLLIFEDLKGNLKTCFMELIAFNHPEKLQQLRYKNYQDFDGIVNFYEMDGTLAKGWIITKGKVTAGTKASIVNGLSKAKNSGLQTQAMAPCGTINVLKWREKCVSTTGIEGYGGGGYMECTWEQYNETQTRYCDVPQEEEEGGYIPGPAGNGGDPEPEPGEIMNELDGYPCAKSLVENMPSLKGDIADKINKMFGKKDDIKINFYADPSLNAQTDGELNKFGFIMGKNIYGLGLNTTMLGKASKEYILVTMYHEAMHAYLAHKKKVLGDVEFQRQFNGFEVNGGRLMGAVDPQHATMAHQDFISGLAGVIKSFNSSFSTERATALAKLGIVNLTPAEIVINAQERDTTVPGYTGTKCP